MKTSNWIEVPREIPDLSDTERLAEFKLRVERPLRELDVEGVHFVSVVPTYQNDAQVKFQFAVMAESPAEAYSIAEQRVDAVLIKTLLSV